MTNILLSAKHNGKRRPTRSHGLAVIDKFKSRGVRIETRETQGGHTWEGWRLYLYEVGPKLFRWGYDAVGHDASHV